MKVFYVFGDNARTTHVIAESSGRHLGRPPTNAHVYCLHSKLHLGFERVFNTD